MTTNFEWTLDEADGTWKRDLWGPEMFTAQVHRLGSGHLDISLCTVFTASLAPEELEKRMAQAWRIVRDRFPQLAVRIVNEPKADNENYNRLHYNQASAATSAEQTFVVHRANGDDEAFRKYHSEITSKPCGPISLHLFRTSSQRHAAYLYAPHTLVDIEALLHVFNRLFQAVATPAEKLETDPTQRLPPPVPIALLPSVPSGDIPAFIGSQLGPIPELMPGTPKLQLSGPLGNGSCYPTRRQFDEAQSAKILAKLKQLGLSIAHAQDAGAQLAIAEQEGVTGGKSVNYPVSVGVRRFFKPDLQTEYVAWGIGGLQLTFDLGSVDSKPREEKFLDLMRQVQPQYQAALKDATIATSQHPANLALGVDKGLPPLAPPSAHVVSSVGRLDDMLRPDLYAPVIKIEDVHEAQRHGIMAVPTFHTWTLNGRLTIQMSVSEPLAPIVDQVLDRYESLLHSLAD